MDRLGKELDLRLSVICCLLGKEQQLEQQQIAELCECSRKTIYTIEKRAMEKIRKRAPHLKEFLL